MSALWNQSRVVEGLNAIDWSSDTIQDLEKTVTTGVTAVFCSNVRNTKLIKTTNNSFWLAATTIAATIPGG